MVCVRGDGGEDPTALTAAEGVDGVAASSSVRHHFHASAGVFDGHTKGDISGCGDGSSR